MAVAEGRLRGPALEPALSHIDNCATCRSLVGQAARLASQERQALGRYLLLDEIGAGGMGRVLRAYDPKLRRDVALKVVRVDRVDAQRGGKRLLREARALARLSHPNVVSVFDVEDFGDEVFIAMELVAGVSLRAWLEQPRSPAAIERAFVQAGRGLEAAHAATLVHRDFKPANVMVAPDRGPAGDGQVGRVVVLDFGLARPETGAGAGSPTADTERAEPSDFDSVGATEAGAVVGTPTYMAPEQYTGQLDARSDQYSFCLAFVEALCGCRPFPVRRFEALRRAKAQEALDPAALKRVPSHLLPALRRGLAADPRARWPNMAALLNAIERRPRRRLALFAALGSLLGVAAVLVALPDDGHCGQGPSEWTRVYDGERLAEIRDAFASTRFEHTSAVVAQLSDRIDALGVQWLDAHRAACDAATTDPTLVCLHGHLRDADYLLDAFTQTDPAIIRTSLEAVGQLPRPTRCFDSVYAATRAAVPAGVDTSDATRVADAQLVEADFARAVALRRAGRYFDADNRLGAVILAADELGYEALAARALAQRSQVMRRLDPDRAREVSEEAYRRARLMGDDASAASVALDLVVYWRHRGNHDEAKDWLDHARIEVDRARDEALKVSYEMALAAMYQHHGQVEDAIAASERAAALARDIDAQGSAYGFAVMNLAHQLLSSQNVNAALLRYREAETVLVNALGQHHPKLVILHVNLGLLYRELDRPHDAVAALERAATLQRAVVGPHSREAAQTAAQLGRAYAEAGRLAEGHEELEWAARAIGRTAVDPLEHSSYWAGLGEVRQLIGDRPGALQAYLRGLELIENAEPSPRRHATAGALLAVVAAMYDADGRNDELEALRDRMADRGFRVAPLRVDATTSGAR